MCKILITDDHPMVRLGLKRILQQDYPGVLVMEAASAEEALAQVESQAWDLVILDVVLPTRSGLDILEELCRRRPGTPVLCLSSYGQRFMVDRARELGATGYISKEAPLDDLLGAIRAVLSGTVKWVSPKVVDESGGR
jgi:DNA-binding NarL/FixJ family response regulator